MYLLIKYIKSVLWRVAKCLSYIQEAQCLKVNFCLSHLYVQPTHQHLQYTQEADLSHSLPVSHIFSCTSLTAYSKETMMNHLLVSSNLKKKITQTLTCTDLWQVSFKHLLIVKYSLIISHMNSL